jgi:AcrR family transcriptional regulator
VRRRQIADATLQTIARHGIRGATVVRIAEAAGISVPAIYKHFQSRTEVLETAVDILSQRALAWLESSSDPDMLERLRDLFGSSNDGTVGENRGRVITPLFEISAAACGDGLTHSLETSQATVLGRLVDIVEKGKAQGRIRADVHAWVVVSGLVALRSLTSREGFERLFTEGTADELLDYVLTGITAKSTS